MTVVVEARPAARNGKRGGPPERITLPRAELVGNLMDLQVLAEEAIDANGASLQQVMRMPAGPWRDEMQRAHIAAHQSMKRLLIRARLGAGRYDGVRPPTGS